MPFPTTVDPIADGSLGHWSQVQGVQRITVGPTMYNVMSDEFGGVFDGVTDVRPALQAALTKARLAPGIVFAPPGVYPLSSVVHPLDSTFFAALVAGAKTQLMGAGRDATTFKLMNSQAGSNNFVIANYNVLAGGDEQITFQDFSIDGNAANQSPTGVNEGCTIRRARGVRFLRVRSFNSWGIDLSTHEGADFNVNWSTDISFTDCECPNTATATASGFSANYTTGLKYENCVSFGSGHGNGFTHAFCRQVQHSNCHSYLNANDGFNSENSDEVVWLGCVAGGQAATQQAAQNPNYPYATNLSLGNTVHGFGILGSTQGVRPHLVACTSRNNGANGLALNSTNGVRIIGGDYSNNGSWGLQWNSASDSDVRLIGSVQATGNGAGAIRIETIGVSFNPRGQIPSPTVPASGTPFTAPYGVDATVFVTPGASTCAVSVAGVATGITLASGGVGGTFRIPSGQTITLTYTNAPTWIWMAD